MALAEITRASLHDEIKNKLFNCSAIILMVKNISRYLGITDAVLQPNRYHWFLMVFGGYTAYKRCGGRWDSSFYDKLYSGYLGEG